MKSYIGHFLVLVLFLSAILIGIDLFIIHPSKPISEFQPAETMLQKLEIVSAEKTEEEILSEFPSSLVQIIEPVSSNTNENDSINTNIEKNSTPLTYQPRSSEDIGRFRIFSILLALLGAPLFAVMGAISLFVSKIDEMMFIDVVEKLTNHPLFITLPLFTFAGYVLSESKAPERLVRFSRALLGWFPGGTAFIAAISCAFFTAFTGASGVTIVALGGLLYPMLIKDKYSEKFTLGMITSGGSLGLLFPPSLPLILYAVIANSSMQGLEPKMPALEAKNLFIAGIIPGLLMVLAVSLYGSFLGYKKNEENYQFSMKELAKSTWSCLPELAIPVIIVATFFKGLLQLTESAAVIALYVVVVEVFLYRDIKISRLWRLGQRSMIMIGAILIILMMAMAMTNLMIMAKVPDQLLGYMKEHIQSPWTFLLCLNIFLLLVGCLMDIFSAILVVVPLIVPIAVAFHIDPLHLGVVFLVNLSIGYCTPPVGMNLFLSSLRFNKSVFSITYTCLPFLGLLLSVLGIITYIPAISLEPVKNPLLLGIFLAGLVAILTIFYLFFKIFKKH